MMRVTYFQSPDGSTRCAHNTRII